MEKRYGVYENDAYAHQVGECYKYERRGSEGESFYFGESLEEAKAVLESVVAGWDGWFNIIETGAGLDTVEYKSATLDVFEDDGEGWFEWCEELDYRESLPDEVKAAMASSERSYHAFLDYADDGYYGLLHCVDMEDG